MSLLNLITDPYERKARVTPGLMVVLPILLPLISIYGPKSPILTGVVGLLGGCGAIYAMANIVRGAGKKLENKLIAIWGGMPTTIILRHSDGYFDRLTKKRYHGLIFLKLQIQLPSSEEESADRKYADECYIAASRRLRELTRGNKQLLLKENMAYGFHRNMLAVKITGIITSFIGIFCGLILLGVNNFPLDIKTFTLSLPGLTTLLASTFLFFAWIYYFNEQSVKLVGYAYAERLFECLDKLPTPRKKLAV